MSDVQPDLAAAPTAEAPTAEAPAPAAPEAPAPEAEWNAPDFENIDYEALAAEATDPKEKSRLSKLNAEHKRYRDRFAPWEQTAAAGLHPTDLDVVAGLAAKIKGGDRAAVGRELVELAKGLMGDEFDGILAPEPAPDPDAPVDVEKLIEERARAIVEERLSERDQQRATAGHQQEIANKITGLGYSGVEDPTARTVMLMAADLVKDNADLTVLDAIDKAHGKYVEVMNERVVAFAKSKEGTPGVAAGQPAAGIIPAEITDPHERAKLRYDMLTKGATS